MSAMASGGRGLKRQLTLGEPISPPPVRRKVQSTTTKTAVASFFTPSSQKPPEKTLWQERGVNDDTPATLLVGTYGTGDASSASSPAVPVVRRKIAAFDFDSTLIQTMSGKTFAADAQDWRWWHVTVPGLLRQLHDEQGYIVVVISNQAGLALKTDSKLAKAAGIKVSNFKRKVAAVFTQLDFPIRVYAATEKDIYRKPRTGMWKELLEDHDLQDTNAVDLEESFFVGDAGGRTAGNGKAKDFSCSDRNFASNVGIKFFTPEEYFLNEAPRLFQRSLDPPVLNQTLASNLSFHKTNEQDLVIFCGSPGSGKSTFFWRHLQPLQYMRVNQDILKTRERCLIVAGEYLAEGKSVAIDNTNADKEVRSKWIELARNYQVPIRCVHFLANSVVAEHNDAMRALNPSMNPEKRLLLPRMAFTGFASRYQMPELIEGFQDIVEVPFEVQGTDAERKIWAQYWI